MTLVFGQRMVRVADGVKGVVTQDGPDLRIVYIDRGDERRALKSEKWVPDELAKMPLRFEEKWLIALYADKALRAHELHEPHKVWEKPNASDAPYDRGLVNAILTYLTEREAQ